MKVLVQRWQLVDGDRAISISKDREQLDASIKNMAPEWDPEIPDFALNDDAMEPSEPAYETEISDDSVFAEMVEYRTVFLHADELGVLSDKK